MRKAEPGQRWGDRGGWDEAAGHASRNANVDYEQIAQEILEEAKVVEAAEDELYGEARGDELPEQLRTGEGRRAWLREAKRQLEQQRAREARPVPRNRGKRLASRQPHAFPAATWGDRFRAGNGLGVVSRYEQACCELWVAAGEKQLRSLGES